MISAMRDLTLEQYVLRAAFAIVLALIAACSKSRSDQFQGYVEGEFVNVAAPIAGRLEKLSVRRGDQVTPKSPLYSLEAVSEAAAEREAQEQLRSAEARLADLRLGRRPAEQNVTRAQLDQATVDERRTGTQLARDEAQFKIGGISQAQLDDARAAHSANVARVAQLRSELTVAQLPSRDDQVKAQAAQVAAARAVLDQARWKLDQKTVAAPRAGRVQDTLFRVGEWVAAGAPVVRILPPENIKVRFFVPQPIVGTLSPGRSVRVVCEGCGDVRASVDFVSTEAEFTPPVIFSNETRSKLVFMVEARPDPGVAPRLLPGQPVSVMLQ